MHEIFDQIMIWDAVEFEKEDRDFGAVAGMAREFILIMINHIFIFFIRLARTITDDLEVRGG